MRGRLRAVVHHDANRGGEHDLLGADLHRGSKRAAHALGKRRDVVWLGLGNEEDGELIAAEARERILRVEVPAKPAGKRQQHAVADDEPEALVHVLEAVDVDEEKRRPVGLALARPRDRARDAVHEQLAVGKPGEAVMHGVMQ